MPRQDEAEILRTWLINILAVRDWSADRLAREAGVAPTTLTRFLNHQTAYQPSWRTVTKVARAVNVEPPRLHRDIVTAGVREIPLYYPDDVREHSSGVPTFRHGRTVVVRDEAGSLTFAAVVSGETYTSGGVYPGDMVICSDTPEDSAPVLVKIGNQLCVYRLRDRWLLPQSAGGYEPVAAENTLVLGRVVRVERQVT